MTDRESMQPEQRTGNCLLTGVCAAEGHRIQKAQSEPEPVVWMYQDKSTNEVKFQKHMRAFVDHGAIYEVPLYIAPPQRECAGTANDRREWQGLTDEEIEDVCWTEVDQRLRSFARAIEAKLKQRNS